MTEQNCPLASLDLTGVEVVRRETIGGVGDYRQARGLAEVEAGKRFAEFMLLSWYDRERDFESPGHVSECAGGDKKTGYIHYALSRGAKLQVEVDGGRFIFFYVPVEW